MGGGGLPRGGISTFSSPASGYRRKNFQQSSPVPCLPSSGFFGAALSNDLCGAIVCYCFVCTSSQIWISKRQGGFFTTLPDRIIIVQVEKTNKKNNIMWLFTFFEWNNVYNANEFFFFFFFNAEGGASHWRGFFTMNVDLNDCSSLSKCLFSAVGYNNSTYVHLFLCFFS